MTKKTVEKWKSEERIPEDDNCGYTYLSPENVEMIELHVDDYNFLHDVAEGMGFGQFGGNLSVCMPANEKPLMIFGQDESVFNQYLFGNRQWVGPRG